MLKNGWEFEIKVQFKKKKMEIEKSI